jgi:predicted methyltransferase
MYRILILLAAALSLSASQPAAGPEATDEAAETASAEETGISDEATAALAATLDAQSDEQKTRYQYRHPQETLEFVGIEPGMAVFEGLPGRGWYTKVLLPYLGAEGRLVAANYAMEMWPHFSFGTEEFVERMSTWTTDFPAGAEEWRGESGATVEAFVFGSMPPELAGTADVVFFPRVLHNLARFQSEGVDNFLDYALADAFAVLKPGGTFGVVQHHARDDMPDDWAYGGNGYLKKQFVIEQAEKAGFEFVAESDINANPLDQPTTDDVVWRLPPTFATSGDNEELRAQLTEIGESNRMTLKFRKPE